MVRIIITGVRGKMGSTIFNLALKYEHIIVTGVTETRNHPYIGKTLESRAGTLTIEDELQKVIEKGDVIIDFTEPSASLEHFRLARTYKKAVVIGTTGFNEESMAEIKSASGIRAVVSPNMSVGMNLMFDIVEKLSRIMKDDYDIEIMEMHHRLKKDAPSGTAMRLKDIVESSHPERSWIEIFGRKGITGERKREELGVLSLRGGDVVGEHTVLFAGVGERLEITHRAYSRENFARGALIAAQWIVNQRDGIYTMKDVLGL